MHRRARASPSRAHDVARRARRTARRNRTSAGLACARAYADSARYAGPASRRHSAAQRVVGRPLDVVPPPKDAVDVATFAIAILLAEDVPEVGERVQRDRQWPRPTAYPGRLVEPQRLDVGRPCPIVEQAPTGKELDRRVSATEGTEVNHANEPVLIHQ